MVKASEIINTAMTAYIEKWGYIWGKSGQVWTQAAQDAATREMTVKYGKRWVGKKVADCSGLFVYAYKKHGLEIYHGSNTIWNDYIVEGTRGALAGAGRIRVGAAVFQNTNGNRGHIGWYIGGGKVLEERGTKDGCILSPLSTWDEYGELKELDYSGEAWEEFDIAPLDVLSKGARGELVEYIQLVLKAAGYYMDVDGIFGAETDKQVREFQRAQGLAADGKVGAKTWAAIKGLADTDEPEEPVEDVEDPDEELTVEERLERLERAVFGEGGEANGR